MTQDNHSRLRRLAQSWSIDVLLAIVIFGFIAAALVSFGLLQRPDIEALEQNAERVTIEFSQPITDGVDTCPPVLVNDTVDVAALDCLYKNISYSDFRSLSGLRADVCVFIEDENGQVIPFGDGNSSWGSPEVSVAGLPCGSMIP